MFKPAVALGALALLLPPASSADASSLGRDRDPVVLTGSQLPSLLGQSPGRIVAFAWDGSWIQVPVQIDERASVDFGAVYDTTDFNLTFNAYTDSETFTGADPDSAFDGDDELVLRGSDAGMASPGDPEPAGTVPGSGVELWLEDPVGLGTAYLYLFVSAGALQPEAGAAPILNNFVLLSGGDYKTDYNTVTGPNPEDTWIVTPAYAVHFADRWIRDVIRFEGVAPGPDLLDRHKSLFAPGNCARSEDTFSAGEGAFIVNKAGVVRALRGYVGANSGVTTYRVHAFYAEREDVFTALRVHAISGILDYFDYSPAASGMTYYDDANLGGIPVDGSPDAVASGMFAWDMVTGTQGTLVHTPLVDTDIPGYAYTLYYSDEINPSTTQCTGDDDEYGASGLWTQDPIPNTDPGLGSAFKLETTRVIVYAPGPQPVAFAQQAALEAQNPIVATASAYAPAATGLGDEPAGTAARVQVSPHPVRRAAELRFHQPETGPVRVEAYDVRGARAGVLLQDKVNAGEQRFTVSLATLPAGVYFLRVSVHGGPAATVRVIRLP